MAQIDSLEVRIEANAQKASNAIHALQANLRSLRGTLNSTVGILGKDVFKDLIKNADKVETSMRRVSKAAKEIDFSKIAAPSFSGMNLPKVQKFLEDQEKALQKFRDKAAKDEAISGKVPIGTQYDIEKAKVNVAAAKEEIAARQQALQAAIEQQAARRAEEDSAKRAAEQAEREAAALREAATPSLTKQEEFSQAAADAEKATAAIEGIANSEEDAATSGNKAAVAQRSLRDALSSIWGVAKRVVSAIASFVSHTWSLVSALNGAHKSSEKSGHSFKKLAKFLIRYGFGMRSFFFLFRRLRRGMKEGFEHLGTYSSDAQQAIYGLKASVETLKNAFAAGFSNLLGPVTSFLQGVINAIASALNAIGRFIAALGGKGFAIQAIKVSASEMAALDKNTSGAAGSAKKLDKALSVLPFDELNQLNGDKNSGGSGGGGGGGSADSLSASQMFETVALDGEEYIQQLGQRIRDAFLSKDWQTLGEVLADPINKGVDALQDKLDWTKNKPKIEAFTTGVTTTFNSLVKNVNWSKIGLTISDAINDITGAITGLVDGTDWGTLGSSIGTAFNTLLEETDWKALGKTMFSKIKVVLETAAGFIETADWSALGTAIGNFILGALENINLPKLGETLGNLFNGAFRALNSAIQTGALRQFVSDFTEGIANLFATIDWQMVGQTIGDALASIDWPTAIANVAQAFFDAFTGLLGGLFSSGGGILVGAIAGGLLGKAALGKLLTGVGGGGAAGGSLLYRALAALGGGGMGGFALSGLGIMGGIMAGNGIGHLIANRGDNGQKLFYVSPSKDWGMSQADIARTGMTEEQLGEWLEEQGVKASWNQNMSDEYGGKQHKQYVKDLIKRAEESAKLSVKAFGTKFKGSIQKFTNEKNLQKQMKAMTDETVDITTSGGQKAVTEYIAGITSKKSIISSSIAPVVSAITSAFDISGKTKTKGASATSSWFTGANEKYNQTVSSELATLTDKFAKKYNKDSTIKGYGASGASSWFSGANGYNPPKDALSSLAAKVKTALTGGEMKTSAEEAGKTVGNFFVNAFKVLNIPKLNMSVNKSALGTDAARAEKLGKVQSSAVWFSWNKKGGIYDAATIIGYGVGEAGKEAIIPLENRRTMGMIADSILGGYGTQGIADQIVRGVTEAMMMASRSQQINVNATLYTEDNEVLARAVNKGNRAITYRESALAYSGV